MKPHMSYTSKEKWVLIILFGLMFMILSLISPQGKISIGVGVDPLEYYIQIGLVTTLALCSNRSFTKRSNLNKYMRQAKSRGVAFVQIIEPRATGRYSDKE